LFPQGIVKKIEIYVVVRKYKNGKFLH
jgi:hypothetical protein